jgi:hypothetical protein
LVIVFARKDLQTKQGKKKLRTPGLPDAKTGENTPK